MTGCRAIALVVALVSALASGCAGGAPRPGDGRGLLEVFLTGGILHERRASHCRRWWVQPVGARGGGVMVRLERGGRVGREHMEYLWRAGGAVFDGPFRAPADAELARGEPSARAHTRYVILQSELDLGHLVIEGRSWHRPREDCAVRHERRHTEGRDSREPMQREPMQREPMQREPM